MTEQSRSRKDRSYRLAAILLAIALLVMLGMAALSIFNSPEPRIMAPGQNYQQEQPRSSSNGSDS